jgi:large subunit ribosomal protein L24e
MAQFNMDGAWSDHSSDIDESAAEARDPFDTLADMEEVEYVDEMGRTRRGTRREAHEAEAQREHEEWRRRARGREAEEAGPSTSARMDPSQLIRKLFPPFLT